MCLNKMVCSIPNPRKLPTRSADDREGHGVTQHVRRPAPSSVCGERGRRRGGVSPRKQTVALVIDTVKGTNPALKKPSNIPEIYAKMFGRIH